MRWRHGVRTGVEIAPDAVTLVRVRERGRRREVIEHRSAALADGAVIVSPVERNIADESEVERALRAVAGARAGGPVSLSLPDPVARVSLFDVASVPARREEFDRLVRWHVEKTFAIELGAARVTAQRFARADGETGSRVLGAAIADTVVSQYEGMLARVGFEAVVIDLGSFHRFNLFRERMARLASPDHHFLVLTITAAALTVMIYEGGSPSYLRIKGTRRPLSGSDATGRILDEVELSLNAYGKEKDLSRMTHLFLSSVDYGEELPGALEERFHLAVKSLGPADAAVAGLRDVTETQCARAAGALGAAAGDR
jgi:Tfp pilus assembly PilM family ATPase